MSYPKGMSSTDFGKDVFDYFSFALHNRSIDYKLSKFLSINFNQLITVDDHLEALELLLSVEAHFSSHLSKRKREVDVESPLKVLSFVSDLSKSVPPFIAERRVEN
jgi:hypothetical protein